MEQKPLKPTDREYYLFALRIVGDFGATIAVPVVIFVIIGQKLDQAYNFKYLFTTFGFIIAALISGSIIYRKSKKYGRDFQNIVDKSRK